MTGIKFVVVNEWILVKYTGSPSSLSDNINVKSIYRLRTFLFWWEVWRQYMYLARPKSGAPQFFSHSIYRRPRPVNNMLIVFCFYLFVYLYVSFFFLRWSGQTVLRNSLRALRSNHGQSLIKVCLSPKPWANLGKSGQTGDKIDFKCIIGVINGRNEL